jgi:hypothetical protein
MLSCSVAAAINRPAINTIAINADAINRGVEDSGDEAESGSPEKASGGEACGVACVRPRTANRRDREAYNAYMRDYMKRRRSGH